MKQTEQYEARKWKEIKNPKRRKKANLKKEISARFEKAAEMVSTDMQMDELDFFMNLLDDGITLDDIKTYCPEKYEYSREFMENHGLADSELEKMWEEFEDVLFIEDSESGDSCGLVLASDWQRWSEGTTRDAIWSWFDEHYSKGLNGLL